SIVVVARGLTGCDAGEVRRLRNSSEHLCRAHVGSAHHSNSAVRIWQCGSPLNRIVAISLLVPKRIPLALRGVSAANVLNDYDIAATDNLCRGCDRPINALVIGRTHENDGKLLC